MIWLFDLALLSAVSICFGMRFLFLGIVIFVSGIFFLFQSHRTRLLLGSQKTEVPVTRKVRAAALSLLISGMLLPLLMQNEGQADLIEKSSKIDSDLPVIVLIGLFAASLMVGLSVEKRKR